MKPELSEIEIRIIREGILRKYAGVATQAGRTIDEDFPGGGFLFAPDGTRVFATPDWSPGTAYLGIDLETGQAEELNS